MTESRNGRAVKGVGQRAPRGGIRVRGKRYKSGGLSPARYQRSPEYEVSRDPASKVKQAAPNFSRPVVPNILTFQGIYSAVSRAYRSLDEATRESRRSAIIMRKDTTIMECLEARQRATALLNWHLEPEDQKSPDQKELCDKLTKIIERTPYFTEYRRSLQEALWFGRSAINNVYERISVGGTMRTIVGSRWKPINGDKLVFRYDDGSGQYDESQIGIRVMNWRLGDVVGGSRIVEPTDWGMAYFLEPWERHMVTLHRHFVEDAAFEDPMMSGSVHGVGIRSRIYWAWFFKNQAESILMDFLQRSGQGIWVYRYPAGNPQAEEEMRTIAEERSESNVILLPCTPGDPAMDAYGLERVEPNPAGAESLKQIVHDYFGGNIKRYILGQTLTTEAAATGLGSGVADLHLESFLQIVKYDAANLEESLTYWLNNSLKLYNFPDASSVWVRFKIDTEAAETDKRLQAVRSAWEMGAKIKESDVMDLIGFSQPTADDEVLQNPSMMPQQPMGNQAMGFDPSDPDVHGGGHGEAPAAEEGSVEDMFGPLAHLGADRGAPDPMQSQAYRRSRYKWTGNPLPGLHGDEQNHRVGEEMSVNGVTYRLNQNHRWERADKDQQTGKADVKQSDLWPPGHGQQPKQQGPSLDDRKAFASQHLTGGGNHPPLVTGLFKAFHASPEFQSSGEYSTHSVNHQQGRAAYQWMQNNVGGELPGGGKVVDLGGGRLGYASAGGAFVMQPPKQQGGEWSATYTVMTGPVARAMADAQQPSAGPETGARPIPAEKGIERPSQRPSSPQIPVGRPVPIPPEPSQEAKDASRAAAPRRSTPEGLAPKKRPHEQTRAEFAAAGNNPKTHKNHLKAAQAKGDVLADHVIDEYPELVPQNERNKRKQIARVSTAASRPSGGGVASPAIDSLHPSRLEEHAAKAERMGKGDLAKSLRALKAVHDELTIGNAPKNSLARQTQEGIVNYYGRVLKAHPDWEAVTGEKGTYQPIYANAPKSMKTVEEKYGAKEAAKPIGLFDPGHRDSDNRQPERPLRDESVKPAGPYGYRVKDNAENRSNLGTRIMLEDQGKVDKARAMLKWSKQAGTASGSAATLQNDTSGQRPEYSWHSDEERAKYDDYTRLMREAGKTPRDPESWSEFYRERNLLPIHTKGQGKKKRPDRDDDGEEMGGASVRSPRGPKPKPTPEQLKEHVASHLQEAGLPGHERLQAVLHQGIERGLLDSHRSIRGVIRSARKRFDRANKSGNTTAHLEEGAMDRHVKSAVRARQAQLERVRSDDGIRQASAEHSIPESDLREAVEHLHGERIGNHDQREAAKSAARKRTGFTAAGLAKLENEGRDYSSIPHFDEFARELASEEPSLGLSGDNPSEQLWDILREGVNRPPRKHDLIEEAVKMLKSNPQLSDAEQEELMAIPFRKSRIGWLVKRYAKGNPNHEPAGAPDGKGGRFAKKSSGDHAHVRTTEFKNWFGDWHAANIRTFLNGPPVIAMQGNEVPRFAKMKDMIRWVSSDWSARSGGQVVNPEFGPVTIDRRAAASSAGHGIGPLKAQAFYLVPDIIARGRLLGQLAKSGNKPDAFLIAAPVRIGDNDYYGLAEVRRDANMRRMYVHEVVLRKQTTPANVQIAAANAKASQPHAVHAGAIASLLHATLGVQSSTVVNPDGTPKVVYHGTIAGGFDSFSDANKKGLSAERRYGTQYFTDSPENADTYAATDDAVVAVAEPITELPEGSKVQARWQDTKDRSNPSYPWKFSDDFSKIPKKGVQYQVVLKNGSMVHNSDADTPEASKARAIQSLNSAPNGMFGGRGYGQGSAVMPVFLNIRNPFEVDAEGNSFHGRIGAAIDEARRLGHDGVIIKNVIDSGGSYGDPQTTYVTFNPIQIKSATGNRGSYGPDERHTYQRRKVDGDNIIEQRWDVSNAASEAEQPSEAQRDAGNYQKGHVRLHGLDIAIENAKGSRRRPEWPELSAHYGYIKRTEGKDGDHVDVFIGPNPESEVVFVVDQVRQS